MQKVGIWRWIYRPFAAGIAAGLVLLMLSFLAAGRAEKEPVTQLLPISPAPTASQQTQLSTSRDEAQIVRVLTERGEVEEMTMAEYLWRVVAAEMPAAFEPEALRAQAVCARTYTLWKMGARVHGEADLCDDSACCQAYATRDEMAVRWGDMTQAYTDRIAAAIADTDGQVLTYGGAPIQAVFFSSSAASTEDAAAVWGSSVPYLVPVMSPEGEEVPNYRSTVTFTAEELCQRLAEKLPGANLSGKPAGWIGNVRYTASGRVAELDVGGLTLSGSAARGLFELRSACFEVSEENGVFTFSVTGYGHGVGMSQYGANAMAKEGSSWQEIVTHYYTGVEIRTYDTKKAA